MILQINIDLLNDEAVKKIEGAGIEVVSVGGVAWIFGVELKNNQTVAAYPISSINPLAPPDIYMTDKECDTGIDNRKTALSISRSLKKWCKEDDLIYGIKLLKKSIGLLEQ